MVLTDLYDSKKQVRTKNYNKRTMHSGENHCAKHPLMRLKKRISHPYTDLDQLTN